MREDTVISKYVCSYILVYSYNFVQYQYLQKYHMYLSYIGELKVLATLDKSLVISILILIIRP